ncbi:uncharacterized protein LOC134910767 [Pseudophryne corroboree]|uniref:uncharacterized protein LOC134910767 n=1 Tax=Pseudophryne corroboree TaxID=495146 RepID=UPI0030812F31
MQKDYLHPTPNSQHLLQKFTLRLLVKWNQQAGNPSGPVPLYYKYLLTFIFVIEEINKDQTILPNVTLGYHIYDSCTQSKKAVKSVLQILSGSRKTIPNYSCMGHRMLSGFIGGQGSLSTLPMAQILAVYGYTQISYGATSYLLSDRNLYPTFYRIVQGDQASYSVLSGLIKFFGWTWVGVLASDDDSGNEEIQLLTEHLTSKRICVAYTIRIKYYKSDVSHEMNKKRADIIKKSSAQIIILCGTYSSFLADLLTDMRKVINDKTLVFGPTFALIPFLLEHYTDVFNGSLAIEPSSLPMLDMRSFYDSFQTINHPEDKLLEHIWLIWENCLSSDRKINQLYSELYKKSLHNCTGKRRITEFSSIHSLGLTDRVYKAVYSMAHALHNMHMSLGERSPKDIPPSYGYRHQLHRYLQNERRVDGEPVFNNNGDFATPYKIVNWQVSKQDRFVVHVGHTMKEDENYQNFSIQLKKIVWKNNINEVNIINLIVVEQLMIKMTTEVWEWGADGKPSTPEQAAEWTDEYIANHPQWRVFSAAGGTRTPRVEKLHDKDLQVKDSNKGDPIKNITYQPTRLRVANLETQTCYHCNQPGHLFRYCQRTRSPYPGSRLTPVSEKFFWSWISRDVKQYQDTCDTCQRLGKPQRKAFLYPLLIIGESFARVGPLTISSHSGKKYMLTLVNFTTCYPEAMALSSIDMEHVVQALTDIFSQAGLTISTDKCEMGMADVHHIGHWVGGGSIRSDPEKVEFIIKWPQPINQKQVRASIGVAGYYRKFIPHYSTMAKALMDLNNKRFSMLRRLNGSLSIPKSQCSENCKPGTMKVLMSDLYSCCYYCVQCSEGEISNVTDSENCLKCADHEWPNEMKTQCAPKVLEFLSYTNDTIVVLILITTFVLFSLTFLILKIFILYQDTPLVKANNKNLSFLLLVSIMLSILSVFLFLGRPVDATCMLRQISFGILFSGAISCVLGKTIMVYIVFKANKPGSSWKSWINTKLSNCLVLSCSSIQVIICMSWVTISPPFQELDTHSYKGKIIVQCNEGSLIGFYSVLGYMGILAAISFITAFLARTLPDSFNEAKYITFSMLVFCSVWITMIPAYLSAKGKYMVAVEIFAILASCAGLLCCIYFPKCYIILWRPELNTKKHLLEKGNDRVNHK